MFDMFKRLPRFVQGMLGTGLICAYIWVATPPLFA